MNDKIIITIAGVLGGAGGLILGVLVRQPEINKLQQQVEILQGDIAELENVVADQHRELSQMLLNYKALKVYQFSQRRQMKASIQDELICHYAAADYLSLLVDCVDSGKKMTTEDIQFYRTYGKMIEDDHIDDRELESLRPLMMKSHGEEIASLRPCDLEAVLQRIRNYGTQEKAPKYRGLFRR